MFWIKIALMLVPLFLFVQCGPQVAPKKEGEVHSAIEMNNTQISSVQNSSIEMQNSMGELAIWSETNAMELEILETKTYNIALHSSEVFRAGLVVATVEMDNLQDLNLGDDLVVDISPRATYLQTDSSIDYVLTIESKDMAPSFVNRGINLVFTVNNDGETQIYKKPINLSVIPKLTIRLLDGSVTPHIYDKPDQIYLRPHNGGLRVVFENTANNFIAGSEPCMHLAGFLRHCNTSVRMLNGDSYEGYAANLSSNQGIFPVDGPGQSIFYNHFNGADNINRRIYFNQNP